MPVLPLHDMEAWVFQKTAHQLVTKKAEIMNRFQQNSVARGSSHWGECSYIAEEDETKIGKILLKN